MIAVVAHGGFVVTLHQGFSRVVLIYSLLMAVWGLFLFFRRSSPTGGYLGGLILDQGVVTLQGVIGIVLVLSGHRPAEGLHVLYGVVSFFTLPTAYFLSTDGTTRRDSLIFALASLLLVGLTIRAIVTGTG